MEDPAVTRFREYLRVRSVQPKPDYAGCVSFLSRVAAEMGLPVKVVECVAGKPVVIITWEGSHPEWPAIMLSSHMDVVPVFEEHWTHPPFAADKLPNGDIIARGAQDMKCVGMGYLEAMRNLRERGVRQLARTIHAVFVPDEEIGGEDGMVEFIKHGELKKLRVGFALDEGLANPADAYKVYYGERTPWWFNVIATGGVGHGSQFIQNTAAAKIESVIHKLLDFRRAEEHRLHNGVKIDGGKRVPLTLGDVTSVNMTMLKGGVQHNVVPERLVVGFDMRVSPSQDLVKFKATLDKWITEAGCTIEWVQYFDSNVVTPLTDSNVWWRAIAEQSKAFGVALTPEIFPAATDSRFVRDAGVPAIGISPMRNTPVLLHDHNEYLNERTFLEGIKWYEGVIQALASVSREDETKAGVLLV